MLLYFKINVQLNTFKTKTNFSIFYYILKVEKNGP